MLLISAPQGFYFNQHALAGAIAWLAFVARASSLIIVASLKSSILIFRVWDYMM